MRCWLESTFSSQFYIFGIFTRFSIPLVRSLVNEKGRRILSINATFIASCKLNLESYLCLNADRCIPRLWLCDGQYDCPERDDEFHSDCESTKSYSISLRKYTIFFVIFQCYLARGGCLARHFECETPHLIEVGSLVSNSSFLSALYRAEDSEEKLRASFKQKRCVREEWLCDGHRDCANGEDEQNCPNTTTISTTTLSYNNTSIVEKLTDYPSFTTVRAFKEKSNFTITRFNITQKAKPIKAVNITSKFLFKTSYLDYFKKSI